MASEAPSWADQWGAGGIGAIEEDDNTKIKKDGDKKTQAKGGFTKAKTAAMVGAQKIKGGASAGIKWVKNRCQKSSSK